MEEKADLSGHNQVVPQNDNTASQLAIEENREHGRVVMQVATQITSGPLPAPEILRGYDTVYSGAAKIIIEDFQKNSESVREMKEKALHAEIEKDKRGQWMAFVILVLILLVIIVSLYMGNITFAGISGLIFLGVAAQSFLGKDKVKSKE